MTARRDTEAELDVALGVVGYVAGIEQTLRDEQGAPSPVVDEEDPHLLALVGLIAVARALEAHLEGCASAIAPEPAHDVEPGRLLR